MDQERTVDNTLRNVDKTLKEQHEALKPRQHELEDLGWLMEQHYRDPKYRTCARTVGGTWGVELLLVLCLGRSISVLPLFPSAYAISWVRPNDIQAQEIQRCKDAPVRIVCAVGDAS
jgi:hypothetical protein